MLCGHGFSVLGAGRTLVVLLLAAVLSGCGSDGSTPAQRAPNDVRLEQCELVDGTVLGAPTDPVMIDGVATQACRITAGHVRGGTQADLKSSHQYQPLVWLLDGTLEIGDSRTYATLDEFVNGEFARLSIPAGVLRATSGSMIIVHRNGFFSGEVVAADDNIEGGGEWAGIVVNSIGPHASCPDNTSASSFCNVTGAHGYFGGLSAADARTHVIGQTILPSSDSSIQLSRLGFAGSVSEAGGSVRGAGPLGAAVVLNAPQSQVSTPRINVFDSGGIGVEINGGYAARLDLVTQNTQGSAVYWQNEFAGSVTGVFYHRQADHVALRGVGGDVDLNGVTLIDRDFAAGTAISVQGGRVDLTNVLVQNFRGCLQLDANTSATLTGVAFGCMTPTVAGADGTDHAASMTAAALQSSSSHYYEADPGLTADLQVGNAELTYVAWASAPGGRGVLGNNIEAYAGRDLRLIYPDCMGIGTLLPEQQTVTVDRTTFRICQLSGTIDTNARLYSRFNEGNFAWVLDGQVSLGADFAALSDAEQLAALQSPGYIFLQGGTIVYARAGASLTVQPGMQLFVAGNAADPVEMTALPGQETARWRGVRVYGVDRAECQTGSSGGVCAYAGARHLSIEYLLVSQAGDGQPALQLYEVGPGATIDHLAIAGSATTGLALHGGRAVLEHVVLANNVGDQLLWEQGYRGTIRYGLFTSGTASTGQVLHGRNDSANHDASPRSRPTLANLTMLGQGTGGAILLEQGSGLLLSNSIVADFGTCFDIDDASTAALQASTPQEIAMVDVVLSCGFKLALEAEDAGSDYGHLVANSSGVYEIDPQLDENFFAANPALPSPVAGHWGAIVSAGDRWYLGWSGVGVQLSPECDGKGTLLDDYRYLFSSGQPFGAYPFGQGIPAHLYYKVCKLPNSVTRDLELTRYTGADRVLNADGYVEITEPGHKYNAAFPTEITWVHLPVPTIWLLDGTVTVGAGAEELTTVEDAAVLKADPVELTMQPGTWVMATETGGLHITRGARLRILGDPITEDEYCEAGMYGWGCFAFAMTGPVQMFGEMVERIEDGRVLAPMPNIEVFYSSTGQIETYAFTGDHAPYGPLGVSTNSGFDYPPYASSWRGITVDGFARNNRCEEAATAEPDSRVCNVGGELGYHGGYDDDYANLEVENLYMIGGLLRLNSVAGLIDGLHYQSPRFSDAQVGDVALIELDGGTANLREVVIDLGRIGGSGKPGTLISWNHGYQGSLQYIYGASAQIADGSERLVQANGRNYFIPLLRGANGDPGHENDLPRSLPTIANLSLRSYETETATGQMTTVIDSSLIELARGSGLYLHHSVMGATEGDNSISDYCFKLDASAAERLAAGELLVSQLATTCQALSDDPGISLNAMPGVNNTYAGSMAVFANESEQTYVYDYSPDPMPVNRDYDRFYPRQQVIEDYGHVVLDLSASPTADTEFLRLLDYLGTLDYWNKP